MEPVIIVVMWVVIGALAVAIFLPIMNLAGTISG
jgi:type II secretory pathway component PulF